MKLNMKIAAGLVMILVSAAFYFLHYLIFRDAHHIFIYLLGDVAFVFIEVLLVTLVIHQALHEWEKKSHLKKLNMVIETFFSEFGKHLLVYISNYDRNLGDLRSCVVSEDGCDCAEMEFGPALKKAAKYSADIDINRIDIRKLSKYLKEKRKMMINLLQNPNLMEHESFTETLMAIFHLVEELAARDLDNLSGEDLAHTKVDIERAYNKLVFQWVSYMHYIKKNFPYFFLFAMRTNPFDEKASWIEDHIAGV